MTIAEIAAELLAVETTGRIEGVPAEKTAEVAEMLRARLALILA